MIYLFDTNAVADLMSAHPTMLARVRKHQQHVLGLCQPVDYEVWRGLRWRTAASQQQLYTNRIKPQFEWIPLTDADWRQAAQFWAQARTTAGKQLSDVDLLLAALAFRLNAVIVTNDDDFDALPVRRENWRQAPTDDDES